MISPLLTAAECAAILREEPENFARRCAAKQIPAVKISGEWRVREQDLEAFIAPTNVQKAPRVRTTAARRRTTS